MSKEDYTAPTPEEARALLERFGLTGVKAGELVGLSDRQIRKYTGGHAAMPYAVLYTLVQKCTGATIEQDKWRSQVWLPLK